MVKQKKQKKNKKSNTSFNKTKEVLVTPKIEEPTVPTHISSGEVLIDEEQYNFIVKEERQEECIRAETIIEEGMISEEQFEYVVEEEPSSDIETTVNVAEEYEEAETEGDNVVTASIAEYFEEAAFPVMEEEKDIKEEYAPLEDTYYDIEVKTTKRTLVDECRKAKHEKDLEEKQEEDKQEKKDDRKWLVLCLALILSLGLLFAVILNQARSSVETNITSISLFKD